MKYKELKAKVKCGLVEAKYYQRRPVTVCVITAKVGKRKVEEFGYSKVCWPDKWDAALGKQRALDRAISAAAHTLNGRESTTISNGSGSLTCECGKECKSRAGLAMHRKYCDAAT